MSGGCLSESATKDLVNLLVKRGYFHGDAVPQLAHEDRKSDDVAEFSETDDACQLVTTRDGVYMTKEQLQVRLKGELAAVGGRMSVEHAATVMAVDPAHVEQVSDSMIRVNDELITEQYLDRMAEITNLELVKQDGQVLVSELATAVWNMPMELVVSALEKRIEGGVIAARMLSLSGMKVLVTPAFEEQQKCRIRGAFRAITLPTQVSEVREWRLLIAGFRYAQC